MLSINIPVYNVEVYNLVKSLIHQAEVSGINIEIRVYDDGSNLSIKKQNRRITLLPYVTYKEMKQNNGRSSIRNKLGKDSQKKYLLFIDADSKILSEKYLNTYLKNASHNCILCGGTKYSSNKPKNHLQLLRWKYGKKREAINAEKREKNKGFIITSNNFLIDRKLFNKIHFREEINKYGHEDTVLGYDLYSAGFHIKHINNAVEHLGLEKSKIFLKKTEHALDNLKYISEKILNNDPFFISNISFLKKYNILKKFISPYLLNYIYKSSNTLFYRHLQGKNPRLLIFDIYKLCYYSKNKLSQS